MLAQAQDVFRFRVTEKHVEETSVSELFRFMIHNILSVVQLSQDGKVVNPTHFTFLSDCKTPGSLAGATVREIYPPDLPSLSENSTKELVRLTLPQERESDFYDERVLTRTEPRLTLILELISRINNHFCFELDDKGAVRTAELRSVEQWAAPSSGDPYEVLGCLSRSCNARCEFCYVFGNPSNGATQLNRRSNAASAAEADVRLALFNVGRAFPAPTYDLEEILIHPHFAECVRGIRANSQAVVSITTNGYALDRQMVSFLREMMPVSVTLSLNAIQSSTRRRLMAGRHEKGVEALKLLDEYGIPTTVSLVAWPTVSLEEMCETIRHADRFRINAVNVIISGYTRHNQPQVPFDALEYHATVIADLRRVRTEITTPLLIQPQLLEDTLFFHSHGACEIVGVTRGSPAALAGIRLGDVILSIEGRDVRTRLECKALLAVHREKPGWTEMLVRRGATDVTVRLDSAAPDYLYGFPLNDRFGIHLIGGNLPASAIAQVFDILSNSSVTSAWVVTSPIMEPHVVAMLKEHAVMLGPKAVRVDTLVAKNDFFGGNIVMGDMLTCQDIIRCIQEQEAMVTELPDVVIVPTNSFSFGGWFRDLAGVYAGEIPVRVRSKVQFVACQPFE